MKHFHYINDILSNNKNKELLKQLVSEKFFELITQLNNFPLIEHDGQHDLFVRTIPLFDNHLKLLRTLECNVLIADRDVYIITNQRESIMDEIIEKIWYQRKQRDSTIFSLILEFNTHILSTITMLERTIEQFKSTTLQSEEYTESTVKDIMKLKLTIGMFRSTVAPLTELIQQFFERVNHPDISTRKARTNQVSYMLKQITSKTTYLYDNISILAETSNSIQDIRASNIMKTLTIISSIFIPLSFITGVFGMNFAVNDLFSAQNFYILLIIMSSIGWMMYIVFRYKRRF